MNAQSKNLTRIAAALVLAMACGNTWAENSITFEGAAKEGSSGNGINNTGNIDANTGGGSLDVRIRQINSTTGNAHSNAESAANMNQVGEYYGSAITLGGSAKVRIGQGVKFDGGGTDFDASTESASKNNVVKGSITGASQAYISQTGAGTAGKRLANVTMSGGTLKANQTADDQELTVASMTTGTLTVNQNATNQRATVTEMTGGTLDVKQDATGQRATVTSMSGGTLTVNQKATATDGTVNITKFTGGKTEINQGAAADSGGVKSTLTLDSGVADTAAKYGSGAGLVTINQNGSYQTATVKYENSGYNGALNLDANGNAGGGTPVNATVDVKM